MSGMVWRITINSADNARMIWHGVTRDKAEVEALAAEAHAYDPALKIWINSPFGVLTEYGGSRE